MKCLGFRLVDILHHGCIADEMFELMEHVNKRLAARNDSSWPSNRARALTKARDVGFFLGMTVLNPKP
jgi:hypothetical protein